MCHDWIFDVLTDLQSYAERNGLPGVTAKLAETLVAARIEVGADPCPDRADELLRFRSARHTH
jgi:hypothetical protein